MEINVNQIITFNLISYVLIIAYYEIGKNFFHENYCVLSKLHISKKWVYIFFIRFTPLFVSFYFFKYGTLKILFSNDLISSLITIIFIIIILIVDCKKKR